MLERSQYWLASGARAVHNNWTIAELIIPDSCKLTMTGVCVMNALEEGSHAESKQRAVPPTKPRFFIEITIEFELAATDVYTDRRYSWKIYIPIERYLALHTKVAV